MEFAFLADHGRLDASRTYAELFDEMVELVGLAEEGGFEYVFCGEHHAIEMTTGPNPMSVLTYLAAKYKKIRLGTAVVVAPYWHPIRLAGEAALLDSISGGRFELGIGRGAYPYEFNRLAGGITPEEGRVALEEMTRAVRGLWAGDYAHEGTRWSFPETTSTPRPITPGGPRIWISARNPDNFKLAAENKYDLMVWALNSSPEEVRSLRDKRDAAVEAAGNGFVPKMMALQKTMVVEREDEWEIPVDYQTDVQRRFDTVFADEGRVHEGFIEPRPLPDELPTYKKEMFDNNIFGTPEQVIEKLQVYRDYGADVFLYGGVRGVPHDLAKRSLQLFTEKVIPALS